MSRQVKRWIAMGVLGAILAVTFVQLGQWQLRRLEERRERNATVVAHESEGVQPYADVMNKVIEEEDQWYRVTATGTYLPDQFQVRYRSNNDALGSEVLAVMETDQETPSWSTAASWCVSRASRTANCPQRQAGR